MKSATARFPLQMTVVYLLLGGSYILLSDLLVEHLSGDAVQAAHLQTLKGWGFVLVTALVLFLLLRHKWRVLQAEISARRQAELALQQLNSELEARIAERTAELAAAKEAAESADRIKSAFLATMSHELRTPLNSIIGFTGVLLQGLAGPLNEEQQKQLGIVQASGRHLLALINDVLDISRIEAGQMQFDEATFDVRAALERVVRMITPLAERKGLAARRKTSAWKAWFASKKASIAPARAASSRCSCSCRSCRADASSRRSAARRAACPSSTASTSKIASSSSPEIWLTKAPRRGIKVTSPSAASTFRASRRGVREMPYSAARRSSSIGRPGGSSWAKMRWRSRSATS